MIASFLGHFPSYLSNHIFWSWQVVQWLKRCVRALGKPARVSTKQKSRRRRLVGGEPLESRAYLAADPIFQDATQVETQQFYDQTSAQYSATFNSLRERYLPVDIDVADAGGDELASILYGLPILTAGHGGPARHDQYTIQHPMG